MRLPPPCLSRRARLWLIWLLIAFGAMNVFGAPLEAWRRPDDSPPASWLMLRVRQTPLERFLTTMRDDSDVERYFAYAEATLGKPYAADFVRPAGASGEGERPDPSRIVTPPRALAPWRDFIVEYPPGMMVAALAPAFLTNKEEIYVRLFSLEMEIALTLAVWLAARTADRLAPNAGQQALKHAIVLTLALGVIAVRRYDPLVALTIAAAVEALAAKRFAISGAALGLAIAAKGAPVVLAPVFVLGALYSRDAGALARGLAGGGAALATAGVSYLALASSHALDALAYHGARPLQIETIYSGLVLAAQSFGLGPASARWSYGSLNLISGAEPTLRWFSTALMVSSLIAVYVTAALRLAKARNDSARLLTVALASLAALVAFITLGKVFSPQYCVWLIPLAAIVAPSAALLQRRLITVGFALVQAEYPFLYPLLYGSLTPLAGALILARTACLLVYAWQAFQTPHASQVVAEQGPA